MTSAQFSIDDLRARVAQKLDLDPSRLTRDLPLEERWGDHQLNPSLFQVAERRGGAPAAVLVPVVAHHEGPTILLTQRASHLRQHSGQIAFPGGRIDASDASPIDAALREAREEIGLESSHVEPLAYLDPYVTGTGFRVFPVLAIVAPGFELDINKEEVDDAFETPLSFLMTPENHRLDQRELSGVQRQFYAMPWRDRYIWGATAGMLRNMYTRLYAP